jgi:hypothetical protein
MYQKRFEAWGLSKNKHQDDMLFVLHKMRERRTVGKDTSFVVRGVVINESDVNKYFSRKGGIPLELPSLTNPPAPSTPVNISYRTPSPQPRQISRRVNVDAAPLSKPNSKKQTYKFNALSKRTLKKVSSNRGQRFPTQQLPDGSFLSCLARDDVQRIFTPNPELGRQILPAEVHHLPEELMYSISTYFDGSFETKQFVVDERGDCMNTKNTGPQSFRNLMTFYHSCMTGSNLIKTGAFTEARRMLSTACNLIQPMLEAENARTLDCLVEVFLLLKGMGQGEVVDLLRRYISAMASTLLLSGRLIGPWGQICRLIGMLDSDQIEDAFYLAWKCIYLAFVRNLGGLHLTTIRCWMEYSRSKGKNDPRELELMFWNLFEECKKTPGHYKQTLLCMGGLCRQLHFQHKYAECLTVAVDCLSRVRAAGLYHNSYRDELMALEYIAEANYQLKDFSAAEATLHEVLVVTKRAVGEADPKSIENLSLLETWLREWGRHVEADGIKTKIRDLTGHDEIDQDVAKLDMNS